MNAHDATMEVIGEYDGSMRSLTTKLGLSPGSLSIIKRGGVPKVDTLAKVADVCGYDLILRRRIDEYEIPIDELD